MTKVGYDHSSSELLKKMHFDPEAWVMKMKAAGYGLDLFERRTSRNGPVRLGVIITDPEEPHWDLSVWYELAGQGTDGCGPRCPAGRRINLSMVKDYLLRYQGRPCLAEE